MCWLAGFGSPHFVEPPTGIPPTKGTHQPHTINSFLVVWPAPPCQEDEKTEINEPPEEEEALSRVLVGRVWVTPLC